jgi:hypothetical protein
MQRLPNDFLADPNLQDIYALIFTAEDTLDVHFEIVGTICCGEEQLWAAIRKAPPVFTLIKVSERAKTLSEALTKALRGH